MSSGEFFKEWTKSILFRDLEGHLPLRHVHILHAKKIAKRKRIRRLTLL